MANILTLAVGLALSLLVGRISSAVAQSPLTSGSEKSSQAPMQQSSRYLFDEHLMWYSVLRVLSRFSKNNYLAIRRAHRFGIPGAKKLSTYRNLHRDS